MRSSGLGLSPTRVGREEADGDWAHPIRTEGDHRGVEALVGFLDGEAAAKPLSAPGGLRMSESGAIEPLSAVCRARSAGGRGAGRASRPARIRAYPRRIRERFIRLEALAISPEPTGELVGDFPSQVATRDMVVVMLDGLGVFPDEILEREAAVGGEGAINDDRLEGRDVHRQITENFGWIALWHGMKVAGRHA
ncbi:hypothetical protein CKO27_08690 [Thiocystis violacea]|nr:hypothetical protein [Thiocystis violacea]